jgi:hypothetical protein
LANDKIDPLNDKRRKPADPTIERPMQIEMNKNPLTLDPDWATGLKRLYNSVVDEPLPDLFRDLLSKLDENEPK